MRIGILNCSDIAKKRMIPAMKKIPGLDVIIICSSSIEKSKSYAKEFDIPKYTDNYKDLFVGCDAIYISSPPSEHFPLMSQFVRRGIHVICEKSLTTSTIETESIISDANVYGVIIQENYAFQFHPQWNHIMNQINKIGEVIRIKSSFEFPPRDRKTDFRYNKKLGGGALLDAGGYPIKAASLLMSKRIESAGILRYENLTNGVDLSGSFFITDKSNVAAFLTWSFESPYRCDFEITGTEGSIYTKKLFTPKSDESVDVITTYLNGQSETDSFMADHFKLLIEDFIRRVNHKDNSHHIEIIKQSKWQEYAKDTSFSTVIN